MRGQQSEIYRKKPRQSRSTDTVGTILDATAQVFHVEGDDAFNTNRIAERAGISIGSLYQYFPNKLAILRAYVERERDRTQQRLHEVIAGSDHDDLEGMLREIITIMTGVFGGRPRLHSLLIRRLWSDEALLRTQITADHVAGLLESEINRGRFRGVGPVSSLRMFVLVRSLLNTVRAVAVDHTANRFKTPDLQAELLELALAYLKA
ncbi:MAG: TetR/AcrR family transcriptional regulator [Steroidobacteraceae bacterium]|nr:TetR/AcrR family transcriptional regulator [Steroidobacteraceae bacterium]